MTTLQATDRQEIWAPRWLVEVATSSYFEPRLFSTEDLQATTGFYHGRLMTHPTVERNFTDVFWGMTEVSGVVVQLDNADNALDAIYTGDPRGKSLVLRRYDRQAGTVAVEFTGTINDAIWSPGVIELSAVSPDLSIFEQVVPKGTVQAASGIAGMVDSTTAVDLGASVPVIYGNVTRHKLVYVSDDVVNDKYDYLVGVGNLTVSAVYRDGPEDTLHAAAATEYSVVYGVYGNTTIVRFLHRQINFQNGFHSIYADVTGLSTERNFVRAIRTMLSDTVYGLGQTINAVSFNAAEALLDPVTGTAVTGLYVDGILTARPARDCLRDLLMIRGMRLDMNASGEWVITVDTEQTVEKLLLQDGTGVGERTLLGIRNRRRPSTSEKTSNLILRFRPDPLDDSVRLEVRRGVNSIGVERIIEHPYIRDTTTADKVVYYLATREKFGLETVEVDAGQEGRSLSPGDLVRLTYAPMGYNASTMEIRRVRKGIDRVSLLLGAWTADFYGYSAGSLPTEPTRPAPDINPRSMRALTEPQVFTGLSAMGRDTVCMIVDESDNEVDWLVKQGSDIHWGESNFLGTVTTALASKFIGENPTVLSACWDANGDMQVFSDIGTGTLRWARLSKNGDIKNPLADLSGQAGLTHYRPAPAFDRLNNSVWYAFHKRIAGASDEIRVRNQTVTAANIITQTIATYSGDVTFDSIVVAVESIAGNLSRVYVLALTNDVTTARGKIPEFIQYTAGGGGVGVGTAPERLFSLPGGIARIIPVSFMCDNESLLHVLAVDGSAEGVLMYGRLSNEGKVLVPMTPFAKGIYGQGAMHYSQWHVFAPLLGATTLNLLRIEAIPIALNTTEGLFVGVGL